MKRPITVGRVINFARRMPAVLRQPERLASQLVGGDQEDMHELTPIRSRR